MANMSRVKQMESVLRILLQSGHKDVKKLPCPEKKVTMRRDSLTISPEAMKIQKTAQVYGQSENIKFDQNIDIQSYFEAAIKANQKTLENAGDQFSGSDKKYQC